MWADKIYIYIIKCEMRWQYKITNHDIYYIFVYNI